MEIISLLSSNSIGCNLVSAAFSKQRIQTMLEIRDDITTSTEDNLLAQTLCNFFTINYKINVK